MSALTWGFEIARAELRCQLPPRLLLCLALAILAPVIFGYTALDSLAAAAPFECFLSLFGAVLITPLFLPEQPEGIRQTVEARRISPVWVYLVRLLLAFFFLLLFLSAFVLFLRVNESDARMFHLLGAYANGVFLGGMGLASLSLFHCASMAYMIPLAYFCLNFSLKTRLGPYFLFSMSMEGDFSMISSGKLFLFLSGLALIAFALYYREKTRRR